MSIEQRQIVDINFIFPYGELKPHPAIIISSEELYNIEGFFTVCLFHLKNTINHIVLN